MMCYDSFFTFIVVQHLFFCLFNNSHLDGYEEIVLYTLNFLSKLMIGRLFHTPADQLYVFFYLGPLPIKKIKLSISLLLGEFLIYFKHWPLIIFVFCTVLSYSKDSLLNKELLLLLWKSCFFWRNAICLFLLLLTAFEFLSLRTIKKTYSSLLSLFYQFQILYLNR